LRRLPILGRCEASVGKWSKDGQERCSRSATREIDGKKMCSPHAKKYRARASSLTRCEATVRGWDPGLRCLVDGHHGCIYAGIARVAGKSLCRKHARMAESMEQNLAVLGVRIAKELAEVVPAGAVAAVVRAVLPFIDWSKVESGARR
jgi:hypothetical protein